MQYGSFDQHAQAAFAGNDEVGVKHYVAKVATNSRTMLENDRRVKNSWLTIAEAYNALTSLQGDTIVLPPESHSLDASLTWANNGCAMRGFWDGSMMNIRSRIGMSTTFTPMITVSGYGNTFENIYTMHGTAATDLQGWVISGARNLFRRVHFGGPVNAAQGGHASYEGVCVDGSENTFEQCVFGTDTVGRDEATANVILGAGTLTYFRDCLFLLNASDTDPYFVKFENTSGYTWAVFDNCTFMAFSSNYEVTPLVAFTFTGSASCAAVVKPNCAFQNVAAIVTTAKDQHVYVCPTFAATANDATTLVAQPLTI